MSKDTICKAHAVANCDICAAELRRFNRDFMAAVADAADPVAEPLSRKEQKRRDASEGQYLRQRFLAEWPKQPDESPAAGVTGHLLLDAATGQYFFRRYDTTNPRKYVDYALAAEDIRVTLDDAALSLYTDNPRLDWATHYLRRQKRDDDVAPADPWEK